MHSDAFDNVVLYARWMAYVGDHAYDAVLGLKMFLNGARRTRHALLVLVSLSEGQV